MGKDIFKSIDIQSLGKPVYIGSEMSLSKSKLSLSKTSAFSEEDNQILEREIISLETRKQDLHKEIEELKITLQGLKNRLQENEQLQAEQEIKFHNQQKDLDLQSERKLEELQENSKKIVQEANDEARFIVEKANQEKDKVEKMHRDKGFEIGKKEGYDNGMEECKRLEKQFRGMISSWLHNKDSMLDDLEEKVVQIILEGIKKVVKLISRENRNVVLENVKSSLKMLKDAMKVSIYVNTIDLNVMEEYKDRWIEMLETRGKVEIYEDNSIEPGGVLIKTNLGDADARISSQLDVIREQVERLAPIKHFER